MVSARYCSSASVVSTAVADGTGGRGAPAVPVDFDLHGHVGIRLLDARPADVASVVRQLGPLQSRLDRDPDITVRFVDELTPSRTVTFVGLHDTGFDDGSFYLLRGKANTAARTQIPFQDIGGRCDIVCERRQATVPLLLAIVNLTALAKGLLPLHASAFVHRGVGVLATGWAKGGKTETLLAFAGRGAKYVGDEWVYVGSDGAMYGVPEPIRLWRWQVQQVPGLRRRLPLRQRLRLDVLHGVATVVERCSAVTILGAFRSVLRRLAPVVRRQVFVQVPPAGLFGTENIARRARLDDVVLAASHDEPDVRVEPVAGDEVAGRMLASLEDERSVFMSYYRQFRFAFPDRRSAVVEEAGRIERELVLAAIGERTCHWLRHPYPMRIENLVTPVESILGGESAASVGHNDAPGTS